MKICRILALLSLMLVLTLSVPVAFGQSPAPPTNYVSSLKQPDTPVANRTAPIPEATPPTEEGAQDIQPIINACAAAADDLKKSQILINVLESQNKLLSERLETEKRATAVLTELNDTRRAETTALRGVIEAKNQTIAAKDAVIAKQDQLVGELKKKKPSLLKRIGTIALGVAIGVALR